MPTALPAAVLRVATAKRLDASQLRRIAARLKAGDSKQAIRRAEKLSYERVDAVARAMGWKRDWLAAAVWDHRRTCAIDEKEILKRFDAGETLQAIGDRAGITRERVRQIVRDSGRTARRIAQKPLVEERRRERERERARAKLQRQVEVLRRRRDADKRLEKHLAKANALWRDGRSISQIAKAYRVPSNSMGWYIFMARTRLGAQWFPRRIGVRKTG
ncbi:MAG TPA: sigma factor-like helix-turn-helix DNA-binding protein [Planctomycetota bacterium]|nr:sigma factor-like helix-turn-helix DNA-binding protein [Planctomycetota bacterium]